MPSVVFDMDGVLWKGTEKIPDAADCVERLRKEEALVGFLTNNSTRARNEYIDILAAYGIPAEEHEIMTSGVATARYLTAKGMAGKRVYIVGGDGLVQTLYRAGFQVDVARMGEPCDLVVVGWDRALTFAKIARAQKEILRNGAQLIATNTDAMFPAKEGRLLPGAGAMVAAIEIATGKKAEVIGKPNTISLELLLEDMGTPPDEPPDSVWVVGDRLDTDIACGLAFGARTVCVTTGITDRNTAETAPTEMRPEFVIDSLSELPDLVQETSE